MSPPGCRKRKRTWSPAQASKIGVGGVKVCSVQVFVLKLDTQSFRPAPVGEVASWQETSCEPASAAWQAACEQKRLPGWSTYELIGKSGADFMLTPSTGLFSAMI